MSWKDWRAPLIGNELYLNGMNSGTTDSHAARAKAGKKAGQPAMPAKRAKAVIPIIGESSTSRSGAGQSRVLDRVERVLDRQRAAVGEADEVQRLAGADPAAGLTHGEPGGGGPVLPGDVGECGRHGAVGRQARHDDQPAPLAVELADVAAAVGGVGEAVQEDHGADGLAGRLQHLACGSSRSANRPG